MSKSCAIICGGSGNPSYIRDALADHGDTFLVSIDSGANILHFLEITPQLAIGDFDSISFEAFDWLKQKNVEIITHPSDKDKTDLELSLEYLTEKNYLNATIYAALGGRIDHVLGNLLLLARDDFQKVQFTIRDTNTVIYPLRAAEIQTIRGNAGDFFSIIPLSEKISGLAIKGVRWPLQKVTVKFGSTHTISNEFLGSEITVSIDQGVAFGIHIQNSRISVLS